MRPLQKNMLKVVTHFVYIYIYTVCGHLHVGAMSKALSWVVDISGPYILRIHVVEIII